MTGLLCNCSSYLTANHSFNRFDSLALLSTTVLVASTTVGSWVAVCDELLGWQADKLATAATNAIIVRINYFPYYMMWNE